MAADPAFGAYLDSALAADAKGPLVIEVRDAAGALVRRYASDDKVVAPDLAHIDTAPEWIPVHEPPLATAGGHRLVWDLHYATPEGLDRDPRLGGVWAPPGDYSVTLTVDGVSFRKPLKVVPDPRVKASPASYDEAFALARAIEADRIRGRDGLAALAAAGKALPSTRADLAGRAAALADAADPDSLMGVMLRLGDLQLAVDGADGAPSADAKAGFVLANAALARALAAVAALRAEPADIARTGAPSGGASSS